VPQPPGQRRGRGSCAPSMRPPFSLHLMARATDGERYWSAQPASPGGQEAPPSEAEVAAVEWELCEMLGQVPSRSPSAPGRTALPAPPPAARAQCDLCAGAGASDRV